MALSRIYPIIAIQRTTATPALNAETTDPACKRFPAGETPQFGKKRVQAYMSRPLPKSSNLSPLLRLFKPFLHRLLVRGVRLGEVGGWTGSTGVETDVMLLMCGVVRGVGCKQSGPRFKGTLNDRAVHVHWLCTAYMRWCGEGGEVMVGSEMGGDTQMHHTKELIYAGLLMLYDEAVASRLLVGGVSLDA